MAERSENNKALEYIFFGGKSAAIIALLCLSFQGFCQDPTASAGTIFAPKEFKFNVKSLTVEGPSPLSQTLIDKFTKPLQNRAYSLKDLQEISKSLEQKIHEQGYPFYRVIVPPQTLSQGDVKLQIISFTLGEIEVDGNKYFSNDNILASIPILKKTKSPNTQDLSDAIQVTNRHPSKQLQVIFSPGKNQDKLDAKISVNEQRPLQMLLSANNFGTPTSGDYRLTGEMQYSNLWGKDHVVNGSFSTSPDHASSVRQFGGSYSFPIYQLNGWLSAYYAESTVNVGTVATNLTVTGAGKMHGIHYQQYLPSIGRYEHSLNLGIDNRYFINDIQFQSTQIGDNVRSTPFSALYRGQLPWENTQINYYIQWVNNTDLGNHNTQAHYLANRLNSQQDWNLIRYGGNFLANVNNWAFQTTLIGQQSQYSLIAGEQLGIGGSFDVRGYNQRETGADSGQIVKFETITPPWHYVNLFAFFDYGHGSLHHTTQNQVKNWSLGSVGIGARFQWKEYGMGNITYANALKTADAGTTEAGDSRIHFNVVYKLY